MKVFILFLLCAMSLIVLAKEPFTLTELSDELERPWAIAFIGAGEFVITERSGQIRHVKNGKLSESIDGLPAVYNVGQGGLLDVIADPNFSQNRILYFTFSEGSATKNRTALVSAKFDGKSLSEVKRLFAASPAKKQAFHYSGRMSFLPDQTLVFAVGDGYFYMDDAQKLDSHFGKVVRLNRDGTPAKDNPFLQHSGAKPEIFTLGHRNPQGMFYDNKRQILFSNEHGPKGGDEINILKSGKNYGWPVITYGVDYSGDVISELTEKDGLEQPLLHWTPSIAPSSMLVYYGKAFPSWQGHILTTALKYKQLRLVKLAGEANNLKVTEQVTYLKEKGERIRDIEIDDRGYIFLVTDSGKLWQLSPK